MRVYWANAFFSEADRTFNSAWARAVRRAGFRVFLPQESVLNLSRARSPRAIAVYRQDTSEILNSQVVVACLDQESVDAGVACEIGIAVAAGIPVLGVYTDLRRQRLGPGRMYKNLYVLGAIDSLGEVVHDLQGLITALRELRRQLESPSQPTAADTFQRAAPRYDRFIHNLEGWYEPRWSTAQWLEPVLVAHRPQRFLDFGCGTGSAAELVARVAPNCEYWVSIPRGQ